MTGTKFEAVVTSAQKIVTLLAKPDTNDFTWRMMFEAAAVAQVAALQPFLPKPKKAKAVAPVSVPAKPGTAKKAK